MKKRIIGIDLIRVIAMYMIMNYHLLLYGSWMTDKYTSIGNKTFGYIAIALTVISVNLFALISGYVGLNSQHKISRFLELWFQVIFYSWLVLLYFRLFRSNDLTKDLIVHNIFPTLFKGYWYWNGYIVLFALMPVLNRGLKTISRIEFKSLLGILFFITSCLSINPNFDVFNLSLGYSGMWLVVLYVYGAYIKRFGLPFFFENNILNFILIIVNLFLILLCSYFFHRYNIWINNNNFDITQFQYTFPLIVTLAIFVFIYLLKIEIRSKLMKNLITFLGKKSFSAYLLQTNPLIFSFLITNNYNFLRYFPLPKMALFLLLISLSWYLSAIIIDIARLFVWKLVYNCSLFIYWKFKAVWGNNKSEKQKL